MKSWRLFLFGCTLALGCLLATPILAQRPDDGTCETSEFFPQTRHNVCDQFLDFFESRGGARIFGYPITEQFRENGRLVQYFQRVRMEYYPELSSDRQVRLGLLGDFFAPADRKAPIPRSEVPRSNNTGRYFPETGHTVAFDFLEFFEKNGGPDVFGYPVTEFIDQNGRILQYFQHALMEWDPNPREIVLHDLGRIWVDRYVDRAAQGEPAFDLESQVESKVEIRVVEELTADASVLRAFSARSGDQTVWVYVADENGAPVAGAQVLLVGSALPGGVVPMLPTDEQGHTQVDFEFAGLSPGNLVIIDAHVAFGGLTTQTRTFFFSWW